MARLTTQVRAIGLAALISRPSWQKNSAPLVTMPRSPIRMACTSHGMTGRLARLLLHLLALALIDLVGDRARAQPKARCVVRPVSRLADRNGHKRLDGLNLGIIPPGEAADRLDDLGTQGQSEQAGPFLAKLAAGSKVVDLGHVAGRSQQEADREVGVLVMPAQGLS